MKGITKIKVDVVIDCEERYPVYILHEAKSYGFSCTIPLSVKARWERIQDEYETMQAEMRAVREGGIIE